MDRDIIEKNIIKALIAIQSDNAYDTKDIKEAIYKRMETNGFTIGLINAIFNQNKPLPMWDTNVLILLAHHIYDITTIEFLMPSKLYTDIELNFAKQYILPKEKEISFPLVLFPVVQVRNNQWTTAMSAQQYGSMINVGMVNYNPETQREARIARYGNTIISSPKIDPNTVIEITDNILSEKQIPNALTLNINSLYADKIKYDDKTCTLFIQEVPIDITDGWHRTISNMKALSIAKEKNINLDFTWEIRITCFSTDEANDFIKQEDKRNKINKAHLKSKDNSNYSSILTKKINTNTNSILKDQIVTNKSLITFNKGIIMFDKISDVISLTFNPKNNFDVIKNEEYIINGLSHVGKQYGEDLQQSSESFWLHVIVKLFYFKLQGKSISDLTINEPIISNSRYNYINKKTINEIKNKEGV